MQFKLPAFLLGITRKVLTRYAQVVFTVLAFILMAAFSCFYIWNIESMHLRRYAHDAIRYTEANIKMDLLEPETLLNGISESIRSMLINGADIKEINDYLISSNNYVWTSNEYIHRGIAGFYGVFDVFDGIMLIGIDTFDQPADYNTEDRPWYSGAIKAAGSVYMTEPYFNLYANELTITLSKRIFDPGGIPLGIICTNIEMSRIASYAVDTQFAESGYGFLTSREMIIIAHPDASLLGVPYNIIDSGITAYVNEMEEDGQISEAETVNYYGEKSIVFGRQLFNGWYMCLVSPKKIYYKSTIEMIIIIGILCVIFSSLLSWILLRISAEKEKSDERMRLMFDATPLAATFWDKNFNPIDCNHTALELFGIQSKQEYSDRFFDLMPEYQPDGRLSKKKAFEIFSKAMDEGSYTCEFMHRKLEGEPIPTELTLVRISYKNDFIIVGYLRDLRIRKRVIAQLERQTRLLDTVNTSAAILLANIDINVFENSLIKCFDLLGHHLDVDRVQLWQDGIINGELSYILKYQWLSDYGKNLEQHSRIKHYIGSSFPHNAVPGWELKFFNGENICGEVSGFSPEDREFLNAQDIKSIVVIPLFLENRLWGYFRLEDCRNERTFPDEEVSIITSAGLMMISAVNRNLHTVKMREAEERTQLIIDAAPLCVILWDENLNIIDCNQEALKIFGISGKQEFLEKFISFSPEFQSDGETSKEKGGRLVRKALNEGYSRFDWTHQNIKGELIPAEIICVRVKHKDHYNVVEYVRDLREQQAMLREMRKAEIAEESSKAKSNFLAKMSHEIRTPMNAILGIAEIQLQDKTLNPVTLEAFERIYSSGDLLLGIINDILDLSKIEADKLELTPAQYDVASLIHDTVFLCIMRYESKPIEFILKIDYDLPMYLVGDELRIKQILNNLISNAFKYTDEGCVNLNIEVEKIDDCNAALIFTVSDTGQGMTSEQVQMLGSRYERFNLEANRKTEGTGLGMNITLNLIHLMNGDINIDSTPGMGSVFTVRLPQKLVNRETLGKDIAENLMQLNHNSKSKLRNVQVKRDYMPYGRVLIVDDVESNLYVAKGLMAPYGLSIDTAVSGFEAIEKVRNGAEYDVIFMDHMMPKMDGIEAVRNIRNMNYNKSIVALTANALAGQAEMFYNNGFDDFISKPIDIRQLNSVLNRLVRDKQPPEVLEEAKKQHKTMYTSSNNSIDMQLAEFFKSDAKKAAKIIESIYENKCKREDDVSLFIINIHAMKSACANIGETDLSNDAAVLEQAGRERNTKFILQEIPSFLERLYAVIHKLEENDQKPASTKDSDEDIKMLKEKLMEISASCAALDKKTAKNILMQLKEKTWSAPVNEQMNKITEYLLHSEFDEAVKAIEGYIGLVQ